MKDKLDAIQEYKEKIAQMEREIEEERKAKLLNLHREVGLPSIHELIDALREVTGKKGKGRAGISPAVREKIEIGLKGGQKATDLAREHGVSTPTVQKIKKDLGLVKARA